MKHKNSVRSRLLALLLCLSLLVQMSAVAWAAEAAPADEGVLNPDASVSETAEPEEPMTDGLSVNDGGEGTDTTGTDVPTGTEEPTDPEVPTNTDVEEPEEDQTGLAKPKNLKLKWSGDNATFSWDAVEGAKHYRTFYKVGDSWQAAGDTDETSIELEDVDENAWAFAVRCLNKSGTYAGDYTAIYRCATPKLVSAENNGKQVKVTWKKVPGAKQYVVFWNRYTKDKKWKQLTITSSTSATQKGSIGDEIRYTVRAITADGDQYASEYDEDGLIGLGIPKLSSVKNSKKGTLDVVWLDASGADGYEVRYVLSGKETKKKVKGWSKTKYSITKLMKGKTYEVSVRTWKKLNGKTFYSSWSAVKKVKVKK